jgi:ribosomal protein L35
MFGLLKGLIRPVVSCTATMTTTTTTTMTRAIFAEYQPSLFVRTLMKSHKGAAKRWRKTANSFKRRQSGRNHGNTGWSRRVLSEGSAKRMSNPAQTRRLKKLLPYH